jgi:hypothetical protein
VDSVTHEVLKVIKITQNGIKLTISQKWSICGKNVTTQTPREYQISYYRPIITVKQLRGEILILK